MNKVGDIKKKIKFAFFPVKITNRLKKDNDFVWLKKYVIVFEYKQLKLRRMLPAENIVREDGKPVFDERFCKYERYTIEKWVRIGRYM